MRKKTDDAASILWPSGSFHFAVNSDMKTGKMFAKIGVILKIPMIMY